MVNLIFLWILKFSGFVILFIIGFYNPMVPLIPPNILSIELNNTSINNGIKIFDETDA